MSPYCLWLRGLWEFTLPRAHSFAHPYMMPYAVLNSFLLRRTDGVMNAGSMMEFPTSPNAPPAPADNDSNGSNGASPPPYARYFSR